MKDSTSGILQSSRLEDTVLTINAAAQGGVQVVEMTPKSPWAEELPPGGYGADLWDDLEDGITTSRRGVLVPSRLPASTRVPRSPKPPREDKSLLPCSRLALSA
jgi:hypothetical protein